MTRRYAALLTTACVSLLLVLLSITAATAEEGPAIRLDGSKYVAYSLTSLARQYMERRPDIKITLKETDPDAGLRSLVARTCDGVLVFGRLDKDAEEEAAEAGIRLANQILGWGAVAIVTHPKNPVNELTVEQIRKIFSGEYKNWKQLGGLDEPIVAMTRNEADSGTERLFRELVLRGFPVAQDTVRVLDHDIVRTIWKHTGSIADARFVEGVRGRIKGMVKIVAVKEDIDSPGILPSAETMQSQAYPLSAPLLVYYNSTSAVPGLRDFAEDCSRRGLIPHQYTKK